MVRPVSVLQVPQLMFSATGFVPDDNATRQVTQGVICELELYFKL